MQLTNIRFERDTLALPGEYYRKDEETEMLSSRAYYFCQRGDAVVAPLPMNTNDKCESLIAQPEIQAALTSGEHNVGVVNQFWQFLRSRNGKDSLTVLAFAAFMLCFQFVSLTVEAAMDEELYRQAKVLEERTALANAQYLADNWGKDTPAWMKGKENVR